MATSFQTLIADDLIGVAIFLLVACLPLTAVSVISYRMSRRGWWLALPWGFLAAVSVALGALFHLLGVVGGDTPDYIWILVSMVVGGWIACGLQMATLAIVGPDLPELSLK